MTIPSTETLEAEQASFDATIRDIEAWWQTPRQQHVKRPWTARTVAALRGSQTLSVRVFAGRSQAMGYAQRTSQEQDVRADLWCH